jgi:ATP phosphoribosyltransferase
MIKIGLPNKGRLSEQTLELLNKAGFKVLAKERKLSAMCQNFRMEVIFVRADNIPSFLEEGIIDLGITGLDLAKENNADIELLLPLDFGRAELVLAAPKEFSLDRLYQERVRIATSFPRLTREFCNQQKIDIDLIEMSGAVELAPKLGIADIIVDLTSSGETLKMNDLFPVMSLLETKACLFANRSKRRKFGSDIEKVTTAFQSILLAHEKKFLIANAPKHSLSALSKITPGLSGPTIMSILGNDDLCAIQVVIDEKESTEVINRLKQLGATGILITNVEQIVP